MRHQYPKHSARRNALEAPDTAVTSQCHLILGFSSRWSINYPRLVFIVPGPGLSVPTVSPTPQGRLEWHCQLCSSRGYPAQPVGFADRGVAWPQNPVPSPRDVAQTVQKANQAAVFIRKHKIKGKKSSSARALGERMFRNPWGWSSQLGPSLWDGFCAETLPHFGTDRRRNYPFPPNDFHLQTAHSCDQTD